jgi:DinB superfamily
MSRDLIDYMAREIRELHRLYNHVTSDLDDAQVNSVPAGGHQSLAFCLWHYVRTEDNAIQFVIQRKPTEWIEGGWPEKFGLDAKSQGTGFTDDQARDFRINGIADFRTYMRDTFARTEAYVKQLPPEESERKIIVKPLGEMSIMTAISGLCMTHGYRHLGEIEFAKGLVAAKGGATI